MIRRPPRSTQSRSSAASDVYKRQADPNKSIKKQNGEIIKVSDLGIKDVPMFKGYNPILSVRMVNDVPTVSMIDITSESLSAYPGGKIGRNLLSNYLPGRMLNHAAPVSYTHLRAHETVLDLVCRLLHEKKKKKNTTHTQMLNK